MDLQQIRYFLAVVDNGTFLAASKMVHVTQPTLSAGIKKLEESLDVTLFQRGSRMATLTPEGEQFLGPARQAYNQLLSAKSNLKDTPDKIILGVMTNIHMDHVADIVSNYRLSHPQVMIEFVVGDQVQLSKLRKAEKVDVLVVNSHAALPDFKPLFEEQLCIVVPTKHAFSNHNSLALSSLHDVQFIERINCSYWHDVNQVFQDKGIAPQTIMQAESDEFVLSLVASDLGLSVMTDRVTSYGVQFIPITDFSINRTIGICPPEKDAPSYVEDFIESIQGRYK